MAEKDRLITLTELAGLLGISRSMFYRMDKAGEIGPECIRLREAPRWKESEVGRWIEAGCPSRKKWKGGKKK